MCGNILCEFQNCEKNCIEGCTMETNSEYPIEANSLQPYSINGGNIIVENYVRSVISAERNRDKPYPEDYETAALYWRLKAKELCQTIASDRGYDPDTAISDIQRIIELHREADLKLEWTYFLIAGLRMKPVVEKVLNRLLEEEQSVKRLQAFKMIEDYFK